MSGATGRRPRVLLVAAAARTSGGGEKHVADLLRRLPAAGVAVALICPDGGDLGDLARSLGVAVCHVSFERSPLIALASLRAAITAAAPDVVHAHGARAAAYVRLADPQAARRVIYTLHGIHVDSAGSRARQTAFLTVERCLRRRTAAFVTVCQADVGKGEGLGILTRERTRCVPNGIELPPPAASSGRFRREAGAAAGLPLVLSVGRFHEQKDQATLLHAWQRAAATCPQAVLALVGSGPLEAELHTMASALGLSKSVRFLPPRPSLAEAYADADVFALSSRWEGLPYVVLEAMAYELPVVATAVDGVPEAVVQGETGLLVPPQEPEALAAALLTLLRDEAVRARLGCAGRARVAREFALDLMVERLAGLYRDIAGRSGSRRGLPLRIGPSRLRQPAPRPHSASRP